MHDILAKPAAIATCGLFNMKRRAKEALERVGLGSQMKKRPSEMSGG